MNEKKLQDSESNPWELFAQAWIAFNDSGQNLHRDFLNLPRFLQVLPNISSNAKGLEIGCGEGTLARKMTLEGYQLDACDIAEILIRNAQEKEHENPLGISYFVENAEKLSFPSQSYDYVVAFMCLMDVEDPQKAISEAFRVLKSGGFFQFSIVHPCFATAPHRRHVTNSQGEKIAVEIGNYTQEGKVPVKWRYKNLPPFDTFHNHKMISSWIMMALECGFSLEFISEPYADETIVEDCPHLVHTITVPDNLIMRFRKI